MRLFLIGWTILLAIGAMGLVARSNQASQASPTNSASTPPSRTAFLHEAPWPDRKELGPETYAVLIDLINATRYYCPQIWTGGGAHAIGTGTLGNQIAVHCTTGAFRISIRPDSDKYSVGPL